MRLLILDEADALADTGMAGGKNARDKMSRHRSSFSRACQEIKEGILVQRGRSPGVPDARRGLQVLQFSATLRNVGEANQDVKEFLSAMSRNNAWRCESTSESVKTVGHLFVACENEQMKEALLWKCLNLVGKKSLVFCGAKHTCDYLHERITQTTGRNAEVIKGSIEMTQRVSLMQNFRTNVINTVISTDALARGVHVHDLKSVINFDLPVPEQRQAGGIPMQRGAVDRWLKPCDTYTHRIGRTGRAGGRGVAISLLLKQRNEVQLVKSEFLPRYGLDESQIFFVDGASLADASSPDHAKVEDFVEDWMLSE